jgi:hypothetical protein
MAGLDTASRVYPTCGTSIVRNSGKPELRCHPRLSPHEEKKQDVDARHKAGHDEYGVMAGLDPAIHLLRKDFLRRMMDPRVISAFTRVFDALLPAGDVRKVRRGCPAAQTSLRSLRELDCVAGHDEYWVMAGLDPAIHLLRKDFCEE